MWPLPLWFPPTPSPSQILAWENNWAACSNFHVHYTGTSAHRDLHTAVHACTGWWTILKPEFDTFPEMNWTVRIRTANGCVAVNLGQSNVSAKVYAITFFRWLSERLVFHNVFPQQKCKTWLSSCFVPPPPPCPIGLSSKLQYLKLHSTFWQSPKNPHLPTTQSSLMVANMQTLSENIWRDDDSKQQ